MNARKMFVAVVVALLLVLVSQAAQAGWEDNASVFGKLFGDNSSAEVVAYFEDGSFVIQDSEGHTYKGCELGMPCDDSTHTLTTNLYLPVIASE